MADVLGLGNLGVFPLFYGHPPSAIPNFVLIYLHNLALKSAISSQLYTNVFSAYSLIKHSNKTTFSALSFSWSTLNMEKWVFACTNRCQKQEGQNTIPLFWVKTKHSFSRKIQRLVFDETAQNLMWIREVKHWSKIKYWSFQTLYDTNTKVGINSIARIDLPMPIPQALQSL